ncbi:hypothetical protein N7478_011051 [Penicillium angulare]|uniref:uncharacterized protein n=1 Tax=Penicillium angulare TaxID=116970 RepID=UPI002541C948|nr:uncharacterized protein N7478_011051 [Penicillium angulare]KAJ5263446.1 hypothetical protein N7478_011051 [Penicillium angulare]
MGSISGPPDVIQRITQQIGNTPMIDLSPFTKRLGVQATVYAKLEYFNAGGSIKDRVALRMVEQAEKQGDIHPGDTLIVPTSGNTGISIALIAAVKGYETIITLSEGMSMEKEVVLRSLGATVIRTASGVPYDSPKSHLGVAKRLAKELPNAHMLDQFGNEENPTVHELGTAEEIWSQTRGRANVVIAGTGTGGTATGISRGLRKYNPSFRMICVEPVGSKMSESHHSVDKKVSSQPFLMEGIGGDFTPEVLDQSAIDQWCSAEDKESFYYARKLIREEGLLVGGSSGSTVEALVQASRKGLINSDDVVVLIFPDSIRNYLSKV